MSAWFNFQTHFGVSLQGEWQKYTHLCTVLSKDEGPKNIGDSMNTGNLILSVNGVTVSYLILYGSLLPNATGIITNCERSFLKKRQKFFITKCQLFQLRQLKSLNSSREILVMDKKTKICHHQKFIYLY